MFHKPRAEIIGDADVEMFGIKAFKDLDVFHGLADP
jgi:hypothetical protein